MTMFRNLKLLLWKNFILKVDMVICRENKRKTLVTVLEILMPLLFSAIVMYLRFGSLPRNRPSVDYCAIDITSLPEFFNQYPLKNRFQLVYIPSKSETLKSITESVEKTFGVEFEGYPSVPSFENYIIQDPKAFYVLTGIGFDHDFNDSKEPLPLEVKYYLRFSCFQRNYLFLRLILHEDDFQGWSTSYLYPPNLNQEPWDYGLSDGGSPIYNKEVFLAIQRATDKAIMWHHTPNETTKLFESLNVLLKRFPHGACVQDSFFLVLQNEFPLFLMLSFICIELTTINSIALEKERKLKEFMCMMGLHNWQHWVAWFTMFSISAFIVVSFMTILFCTKVNDVAVFKNSDPSLIFVFLMYFAIATIFFAFMISTFFQKAHVATASRGIIFFFTYLPYLYLTFSYNQRSTGIQWRNMGSIGGEFNFTQVLLMLLLDSLLYGLVAWYVESVFPGVYGTPKPWYFFLMVFYKGRDEHMAVKDLTMNLYQGQITVLLGHKGAGKTTTCVMLTGLISPSSGQAYINGYEISQDMLQVRKSMGWCPQHDILFDNLTVAEHLYFYVQLKGLLCQKCPEEIKCVLHILSLQDKRDSRSRFLTGGMRRKLSIGIALIGIALISIALIAGSKVLMLDEPTSGVDAISRRAIWDLPQQHKSDRIILLTTHFMDEADLLGDHIAIMAKRDLQCCGSSLFLKQKYGAGYYMTLVKKPHCNTEKISHLIYQHTPNVIFQSSTGEEITFILPKESVHRFESLFTDLELRQKELGIASFGASVTTMEEVFIRFQYTYAIIKLPSFHSHPLVSRVPVNRIKRLHSRIFSIRSSLPNQPNTGVSKYFKCMQESRFLFHSWNHDTILSRIQPSLPTVLCHVLEKGYIFLVQLDDDAVNTDPGTSGDPYGQPLIPQLQYKHGKCPIGVDPKKHMVKKNPNKQKNKHMVKLLLGPQLSEHFTDMLMAEEQIPLQLLIEPFLLKKLEEEPEVFDQNYLVAASFEDVGNRTIAYHSTALALALVDNVLFKLLSGARASITVFNHPQPQSNRETSENILGPKGHYLVINLLFGMAFLSSSFCNLTVKERCIKTKQVQFISGIYVATFWLSALLWDLISFLIPTLLLLVVFLYSDEEAFTHPENIPAVVLMLMLYAWAIIPFIYLTSFCFDNAGSACVKLIITLTFLASAPLFSSQSQVKKLIFSIPLTDLGYTKVSESLDHTFLLLPGHCLGMAFSNLHYSFELQKFCNAKSLNQTECNQVSEGYMVQKNIYAWESLGMGKYLIALAISGPVYLILLSLIETNVLWELKAKFSGFNRKQKLVVLHSAESTPGDQDVEEEEKMIESFLENFYKKNPLVLKGVSKVYAKKLPPLAVNKVSFTVQAEECFGLLGLSGAGKTSIFKMLTGEEPITSGDAFVNGLSIRSDLGKVWQWIGYCPHFDALLDHMTGKETLVMYARLRGIPERHISACVDQILDDLLMYMYADNLVKTYSSGNKRKLSAGIALLGEPTTLTWMAGISISQPFVRPPPPLPSMEDCEALCTQLAIMVQRQFKCLGSPQHLKSKFGSGYSLRAKIWSDRQQEALEEFKAFVDLTFPGMCCCAEGPGPPSPGRPARPSWGHCAGSVLEDEHQGMVHYHLPGNDLSWAKVFGILEQAKKKYMLEDYSVNQISLEDIFLSFTCPVPPNQGENKQAKAEPAGPLLPFPPPSPPSSQPPSLPPSQPTRPPNQGSPRLKQGLEAGRAASGCGSERSGPASVEDHVGVPAPRPRARRRGRSAQTFTDKPLHAVASGRRDLLPPSQPQCLSPEQARSTRAGADSETPLQPAQSHAP
ncbi:hypothetical protein E2I00_009224 [Balaenoptera physalus]|uniref:ABC transporter domain-containing protein n=1 Tax=Balaenoptera physalus TaxID=9770 RepID=A0A6A1Q1I2_BALPH|nr:hypothetical protein E2I00_009224 [Balaenoptera physalus]